ncbi:hypothetical protein B7982_03445 [Fibrobacter sp. UWB2]|nr:hypothetical protein B7982_03445 [Fibrobacter sp. UWB2]
MEDPAGPGLQSGGGFPLYYRGHFFAKFLNKGCQKGVYNCIFQAVPNDTFKYAHLQKRLILCKLI